MSWRTNSNCALESRCDVASSSSVEIVDTQYLVAGFDQSFAKM